MKDLILPKFKITHRSLDELRSAAVPEDILSKLASLSEQESRGRRKFNTLLQQTIGYPETALYRQVILKAAMTRQRRRPEKKPWWRRLRKPALGPWAWKVVQSTILGAVILLALFALDWLTGFLNKTLTAGPNNHTVDLIKSAKNAATLGMFMVFLAVKVVHNLIGMIED